ncbi:hypothetical protein TSST111916_12185 [Tsukamurella strandjordii]
MISADPGSVREGLPNMVRSTSCRGVVCSSTWIGSGAGGSGGASKNTGSRESAQSAM